MSPRSNADRHEHGQNFLVDQAVISSIVAQVTAATGPLLEIGGGGAVTTRLATTGRPLTVVEIDDRWVRRLRRSLPAHVDVVHADYLRVPHPRGPHVVVASLPFPLTTAVLRRLLGEREWTHAVLLVQWEVARRRAGVGGATLLTAQWWPWYDFALLRRVPMRAFRAVAVGRRRTPADRPAPRPRGARPPRVPALRPAGVHRARRWVARDPAPLGVVRRACPRGLAPQQGTRA